jgi:GNAT superfamily N-acetyltransferase
LKTVGYYFEIGKINVSIVDGKVVGFIIHSEEFYNKGINILIEELIVDSSFQGTGLGKELVKSVEDYARVKDANMVYFFSNKKSRAFTFYKMNGYIPNDDFVIMEKRLR